MCVYVCVCVFLFGCLSLSLTKSLSVCAIHPPLPISPLCCSLSVYPSFSLSLEVLLLCITHAPVSNAESLLLPLAVYPSLSLSLEVFLLCITHAPVSNAESLLLPLAVFAGCPDHASAAADRPTDRHAASRAAAVYPHPQRAAVEEPVKRLWVRVVLCCLVGDVQLLQVRGNAKKRGFAAPGWESSSITWSRDKELALQIPQ